METKIIDGYKIKKLDKETIARYISKVFSSDVYVEIIKKFNTREEAIYFSNNISKILFAYVSSTSDIYVSSAYKIMKDYLNSNLDINDFYFKKVVPQSLDKLGYDKHKISIKQMVDIFKHMYLNSKNNQFFTHSFNGALYPLISKEGLNGDKELFKSEFETLSKISHSPYKTGKLFLTSLGGHSMQYAIHSPERLHMMLSDPSIKLEDNESLNDYYNKCLIKLTSGLDDEIKQRIITAGKTIIDFYSSTNQSCIAIVGQSHDYKLTKSEKKFSFNIYVGLAKLRISLLPYLNKNIDLKNRYDDMLDSLKEDKSNAIDKLITFKIMFETEYPNNQIIKKGLKEMFKKTILDKCLNNFTYDGFGDGIEAKNNKIDIDQIAIARFININDIYISKYNNDKKVRM